MSKKREEIKAEMTNTFLANETVQERYQVSNEKTFEQQFSKVSIENLLFDVVAFAIWLLQELFGKHRKDVEQTIYELKPHTLRWYRAKALNYQYGFELLPDSDLFNNKDYTDKKIQESKIVKYAAVNEAKNESRLVLKVATEIDGELHPLPADKLKSFETYIEEIKDAGVQVSVLSYQPDILSLGIRIYRDPLVLNSNGLNMITATKPVEVAINEYMKELPFNGELILQDLANKLEKVDGVKIVQIDTARSKWIDSGSTNNNNYEQYQDFQVRKLPQSGYFKLENFEGITYIDYYREENGN